MSHRTIASARQRDSSISERCIDRVDARGREHRVDTVVVEAALELRISGEALVTTMRTPGHDEELALGWLLSEGLVAGARDVTSMLSSSESGGVTALDIAPAPGKLTHADTATSRRGALSTSACGVCGRRSVADLLAQCSRIDDESRWPAELVLSMPDGLRSRQTLFTATGGLHAAAAVGSDGSFLCVREDVGRHNAVDKLVGWLSSHDLLPALASALVVSGRASFEIVQKAILARFPLIVCVSAPSSLAIDLAMRSNVTLVGFAREHAFNVYSVPERILENAQINL